MESGWRRQREEDVMWVRIDLPDRSVNTFTRAMLDELDSLLTELEVDPPLRAVIFHSGKPGNFIAGADIGEMESVADAAAASELSRYGQRVFTRLSQLKPTTIALISRSCLGGGLEFALACDYRIADDGPKTLLGLPEVQLGLVPGWGGTVRLPRKVGLTRALKMITAGQQLNGRQAYSAGLVDAVVPPEGLRSAAMQTLQRRPKPRRRDFVQRWLVESAPGRSLIFRFAKKQIQEKTKGKYPAPEKALEVLRAGMQSQAAGFESEAEAIGELAVHPVTRESIRLFHLRDHAKRWAEEAAPGSKEVEVRQAGLLGAGVMGAGIAKLLADRGIEVRLRDLSPEQLSNGMRTARRLFDEDVKRKRSTPLAADNGFRRISPTASLTGLRHADIVIEAVVESMEVKHAVFKELQSVVGRDTVLATNTSSLPVGEIAQAADDPSRVVGVHFFNPPVKMPLVEIVRTAVTSDLALTVAVSLVRKLGKIPVIVGDCPGFLVNRLLVPYLNEAGYLLTEGVSAERLERAALEFGFPMGPLELMDLVGAGVSSKVGRQMHSAYGDRMKPAPALEAYEQWRATQPLGRPTTFYVQRRFRGRRLNPNLLKVFERVVAEHSGPDSSGLSNEQLAERLVYPIVNEAALCLEEGIVERADAVDLAMVFGTGFAPFRGGPMRYAESVGLRNIIAALEDCSRDRPRLAPSDALRRLAEKQANFVHE